MHHILSAHRTSWHARLLHSGKHTLNSDLHTSLASVGSKLQLLSPVNLHRSTCRRPEGDLPDKGLLDVSGSIRFELLGSRSLRDSVPHCIGLGGASGRMPEGSSCGLCRLSVFLSRAPDRPKLRARIAPPPATPLVLFYSTEIILLRCSVTGVGKMCVL